MSAPPKSLEVVRIFDDCQTNEAVGDRFKQLWHELGFGHHTPLEEKLRLGEEARQAYERIKEESHATEAREERLAKRAAYEGAPAAEGLKPTKVIPTTPKGSRFTLAHLIEAGKIAPGDSLTWLYRDVIHEAEITGQGALIVAGYDAEPTESPSRACQIANGGGSFNGWKFWTTEAGKTLAQLRAEVLGD